jgi:TPR repeat protein
MISKTKTVVVIIACLLLAGCAGITEMYEERKREEASRPVYESKWRPIQGMPQQYSKDTTHDICMAVSAGAGLDSLVNSADITRSKDTSEQKKSTEYRCKQSFDSVSCKPKPMIGGGAPSWDSILQPKAASGVSPSMVMLLKRALAVKACMGERGYSLQEVCVKNCGLTDQNQLIETEGVKHSDTIADTTFDENMAAAKQGQATAQYNLGIMYDSGDGVPENDSEAVKWWRKAADQGYVKAQHNLAYMYATGAGVPENSISAYVWFSMAKTQGETNAANNLDILKPTMTKQQIADGQALATKCYESDYKDCD